MSKLWKVEMSKPGNTFYVVAPDATQAMGAADKRWKGWSYDSSISAISAELIATRDQYPPQKGSMQNACGWLVVTAEAKA